MARIGKFKRDGDGFKGSIATLSAQAKDVEIVPSGLVRDPGKETPPAYFVRVGEIELGAGWVKQSQDGRNYICLKLDDPSFNAAIYANLFEQEDGEHHLIWSRGGR